MRAWRFSSVRAQRLYRDVSWTERRLYWKAVYRVRFTALDPAARWFPRKLPRAW